jgi:hypothetical protein
MDEMWFMSGPEEGDTIDMSVFVCDQEGNEVIEITQGSTAERKQIARKVCELLNKGRGQLQGELA